MKVGILTYHRAHNYGAYLQAYALCNRLNEEPDIEAEIIDFRMKKEMTFYSRYAKWRLIRPITYIKNFEFEAKLYNAFEEAALDEKYRMSSTALISDSIEEFQIFVEGKYDAIIAGSDEIWKTDSFRGFPNPYWLIGDLKCRKFSYAASSRSDFSKIEPQSLKKIVENFSEFEYIGVREPETVNSLIQIGVDKGKVHLCCDPTFLYDFPISRRSMKDILGDRVQLDSSKKNIVIMTGSSLLDAKIKKEFGEDYNLIAVFNKSKGYINVPYLKPLEWAEAIKNADMVITTYFHGTCFSIINNTPFLSFGSAGKSSKVKPLFEDESCLSGRYIEDIDSFIMNPDFRSIIIKNMEMYDSAQYISKRRTKFNEFISSLRSTEKQIGR